MNRLATAWEIGEQSAGKPTPKFGAKAPATAAAGHDRPRPIQATVAKLTRLAVPANLERYPPGWTEGDKLAFEQHWRVGDWPCPRCGLIGCEHDDDLPAYRGAFDTEGRH